MGKTASLCQLVEARKRVEKKLFMYLVYQLHADYLIIMRHDPFLAQYYPWQEIITLLSHNLSIGNSFSSLSSYRCIHVFLLGCLLIY